MCVCVCGGGRGVDAGRQTEAIHLRTLGRKWGEEEEEEEEDWPAICNRRKTSTEQFYGNKERKKERKKDGERERETGKMLHIFSRPRSSLFLLLFLDFFLNFLISFFLSISGAHASEIINLLRVYIRLIRNIYSSSRRRGIPESPPAPGGLITSTRQNWKKKKKKECELVVESAARGARVLGPRMGIEFNRLGNLFEVSTQSVHWIWNFFGWRRHGGAIYRLLYHFLAIFFWMIIRSDWGISFEISAQSVNWIFEFWIFFDGGGTVAPSNGFFIWFAIYLLLLLLLLLASGVFFFLKRWNYVLIERGKWNVVGVVGLTAWEKLEDIEPLPVANDFPISQEIITIISAGFFFPPFFLFSMSVSFRFVSFFRFWGCLCCCWLIIHVMWEQGR